MKMKRRPAIDGKIAIITGASSGIGESTAREFARAGAITVLAARRLERLERLAEEIREMGGSALPALRGALAICGRLFLPSRSRSSSGERDFDSSGIPFIRFICG